MKAAVSTPRIAVLVACAIMLSASICSSLSCAPQATGNSATGTYQIKETRLGPAGGPELPVRAPPKITSQREPSGRPTASKPAPYVHEYETWKDVQNPPPGLNQQIKVKVKVVVVNRKPGGEYDDIFHLTVSPDGKRVAYVGYRISGSWVVVDGKPVSEYAGGVTDLIFSPDSRHLAYASSDGSRWSVVVDGRAGPQYSYFNEGSLTFSPDGQHIAYGAWNGSKQLVVLDGKPGAEYDVVDKLIFSPDGVLEFVALRSNSRYRVKYIPRR
jgi:WD40-like Beta Propeller Repeat